MAGNMFKLPVVRKDGMNNDKGKVVEAIFTKPLEPHRTCPSGPLKVISGPRRTDPCLLGKVTVCRAPSWRDRSPQNCGCRWRTFVSTQPFV